MNGKVAKRLRREAAGQYEFETEKRRMAKKATLNIVGYQDSLVTKKVQVQMDEEGKVFEEMEIEVVEKLPILKVFIVPQNKNEFMNKYRNLKKVYKSK
jgi:hypothetical protein